SLSSRRSRPRAQRPADAGIGRGRAGRQDQGRVSTNAGHSVLGQGQSLREGHPSRRLSTQGHVRPHGAAGEDSDFAGQEARAQTGGSVIRAGSFATDIRRELSCRLFSCRAATCRLARHCPLVISKGSVAPIIQSENVAKVYRIGKVDVPALRGVSFTVEKGEFVSIVGPSG